MGLKRRSVSVGNNLYGRIVKTFNPRGLKKTNIYSIMRYRGLEIIYLILLFGLAAGSVNAMLEGSKPNYLNAIILPSSTVQTWSETFINFFTIILGTIGIYLMYQGGRQSVRRRVADSYLLLGVVLLILAIFFGFSLLIIKRY